MMSVFLDKDRVFSMQQTQCIGRIAKVSGIEHFRDSKHRFYIAYRCSNQSLAHSNCCSRCVDRGTDKIQSSGKFDHGLITGPIPDHSHMYGGKWYHDGCITWGPPLPEALRLAEEQYQLTSPVQEIEIPILPVIQNVIQNVKLPKRLKKIGATVTATTAIATNATATPTKPKKSPAKPAPVKETKIEHIVATHVEKDMEEVYIDDYEVEHVKLSPFEHNDVMYYRDPKKNKLFEHVKGGFGAYVGRYDSYHDTIRTDIPDSDDEE
jgi:hypothetical protein